MATGFSGMMKGLCLRLGLAVAVLALLSLSGTAFAASHGTLVLPCERCHTVDPQDGDPSTQYLSNAAPNLSIMIGMTTPKDTIPPGGDGNPDAPDILGCYLCHTQADRINATDKMKNVQLDFNNQTSMHAIGRRISTGVDTQNEFQSNWTGNALVGWTGGANVPDELQCVWCHDMSTDTYPNHRTPTVANPKLLFNVTTATDENNLCFGKCHSGTSFANGGQTVTVPAMGHVGWASFSNNGTPTKADDTMKTARGTALKTADCVVCHNTHSSNKPDMIRDGLSEGGTAIDETNCTAVCHNTPAQWATKGHGQFPTFSANVSCGPCHSTAVSHRTAGNPKRFAFPEDTSPSSIGYNGAADGLDNNFNGSIDAADPGNPEAAWAQPRESMCGGCHQTYKYHGGSIGLNSGSTSCLDCHDPHGTNVAAANIKMIRGTIGATAGAKVPEATAFTASTDYYNATGTGICDNANCHGVTFTTILNDTTSKGYPTHSGASVGYGTDCVMCHRHDATSGGFAANCNDCHNYPPATGAHLKHKALGYNCWDCHFNNNHNPTLISSTPATFDSLYNRGQVEVAFNPAGFNSDANNGALAAPFATKGPIGVAGRLATTCAGLACHNPDNAVTGKVLPADATNNIPVWGNTYDLCTDCHAKSISGDPANKSHNKHDSKYQCQTCHADVDVGPTGPGRATHADKLLQTGQVVFGGTIGADMIPAGTSTLAITGSYAAAVCSNTYCHGNFTGGTTTNLPNWSTKTGGACGNCHGATAAAPPQGNVHPQHTGNDQTVAAERQYAYPCNYCHYTTTSNGTSITAAALHVNGYSEFAFDPTIPMLTGASYGGDITVGNNATDTLDKCATLYCHGAGTAGRSLTAGTNTTPEWNVATTGACGTCHGATAATPPQTPVAGSGGHQTHAGNATASQYAFGCNICHVTATTDGINIANPPTAHVNGSANVRFDTSDLRLAGTLATDYGGTATLNDWTVDTNDVCTNTYCHSQGRSFVPPFGAPNSAALQWDQTATCASCHGNGPAYVDGTPKANKHAAHNATINGIGCTTCHSWFGDAVLERQRHVNRAYDPLNSPVNTLDAFTYTYASPGGTCATTTCHGGNTVSWNENMVVSGAGNGNHFPCDNCHGRVAGVVTNVDVNDFSIDVSAVGAVMSKVSNSEFTAVGHGATAPRNIAKACNACHDSTVMHENGTSNLSGANPFRLIDQDLVTAGIQSCSNNALNSCHQAGTVGPQTGKTLGSIVTHSDQAMAPDTKRTWPAWNPRCTECHDPHGDGSNLSMIQRELYDKGSTVLGINTGSEDWGVPTLPNDNNALVFTDSTTGIAVGSYAETTPNFSGLCQECHERPTASNGVVSFHDGPANGTDVGANHPASPGDCSTCHTHDKAFKAQACYSCHGNTVTGAYWPVGAAYPNTAGAHLNHVNTVGMWIYNEDGNTAGAGLLLTNSPGNPGVSSDTKQKAVCAWCHPNPGVARAGKAGETTHDDNGTWTSPADVLGDGVVAGQYQQYYNGTLAPLPRGSVNDFSATTGTATFTAATHTCSNTNCHNQVTTPSWNAPPAWTTTGCGTIQCHSPAAASGKHLTHYGPAAKNYACTECHVNPASLQHGNGQVNLSWTAGLENNGNGFYDHNPGGVSDALDNNFTPAYDGAVANSTCYNMYCHGDFTGRVGGANLTPTWNGTAVCGDCHGGSAAAPPASGSHATHYDTVYGPALTLCSTCHTGYTVTDATHVNGTTNFETRKMAVANPAPTNLAGTGVCDACHGNSSGANNAFLATVKTAWATQTIGVYTGTVTCESCHGQYDVSNSSADNTGVAAKNVMGNNSSYGSAVTGHTRPTASGQYPVSLNTAANKTCDKCHLYTKSHTWGVDTAGYAGMRIVNSLNTRDLTASTQVEEACNACHQTVGTELGDQVSAHGNQNASFVASINHDPNAQDFAYRCNGCHDVHGMTLNAASTPNVYMVKPQIEVQNYAAPAGGTSPGTTIAVNFTSRTGSNSFDDGTGAGVCSTCHNNANRPGAGTNMANYGGQHAGLDGYSNNEQGNDCTGCHAHTWDATASTQDGFMPQQCNACHTFPGLANLGGVTHLLSSVHDIHVGTPVAGPLTNYAFPCKTCHYSNLHNQTQLQVGQVWSVPNANVNIRFDPARNGATATYAGAPAYAAAAPGVGGTGTCAGLYCHGDAAPFPVADKGTITQPRWNVITDGDCGTCHKQAAANMVASDRSHPKHTASTAGNYSYGCQVCHYTVTTDGSTVPAASMALHVNGSANVAFNTLGDPRVDATSAYSGTPDLDAGFGSCSATYCHSNGTDLVAPYNAANSAPVTALVWGATGQCGDCHGTGTTNSMPNYAEGSPKANKHPKHVTTNAFACSACHYTTTTTGTTIATPASHADRVYSMTPDATKALYGFTWATPNCNAVVCHGGNSAITWAASGPYNCDVCHATTLGVPAIADANDFAWGGATPAMSKISNTEYTATNGGHGSSNPKPIAKACSACHDSTVQHDTNAALTGANPFRLSATGVTCSTAIGCHVSGTTGPATGQDISLFVTHSKEKMLNPGTYTAKRDWPVWKPRCTECHDPHGDANLSMIQRELYDKGSSVAGVNTGAEDWGVPTLPNDNNALVFTDNTTGQNATGNSYAKTTADFSSVCQECHEPVAPVVLGGMVSYKDGATGTGVGGSADGANHPASPNDCSGCHKHDTAFKPSGCNGCHGGVANGNYWPDGAAYPDTAGAHLNHVNAIGMWVYGEDGNTAGLGLLGNTANGSPDTKQKAICAWCHPNPGGVRPGKAGETSHDDNGVWTAPADVLGDGIVAGQYQQYYNGTLAPLPRGSVNDFSATTGTATFTAATHSCSNVNCHNEVTTPTGATNWNTPPVWTTTGCGTIQCHSTSAASGKHLTHYGPAAKNYACTQCHVNPVSLQHGNGQVNLDWTAGLENNGNGYYDHNSAVPGSDPLDNNFTPAYDGGVANSTCYNMYCHGDFTGGLNASPTWNGAALCGTCHASTTGTETSGSHTTHFDTVFGANVSSCSVCHTGSLVTTASHADGIKTIVASPGSVVASTLAATTVCNNCHGIVTYDTEVIKANWPDVAANTYTVGSANSDVTCESCHGGGDMPAWQNVDGTGGRAPAKTANFTTRGHGLATGSIYPGSPNHGAGANCVDCHNTASAHLSGTNGDTNRLQAGGGNGLCNGCHDGAGAGSGVTQVSTHANTSGTMGLAPASYTAQRAQFELNCMECHDVHGSTNIYMINTANSDGPLVATRIYNGSVDTTTMLFKGSAVAFTAKAAGSDYAVTVANANKICQTCHTTTGGTSPVYQHNNATVGHATTPCIGCHTHDIDGNFAANSQDGFMPKGCVSCHDAASPYDPDGAGPAPAAPGVDMTVWAASGHGKTSKQVMTCDDCHDIGLPSGPVTHLDGTYNSVWENGTVTSRNTNTAHLRSEFFTPYTGVAPSGNTWDVQVTFDNRCYNQCHLAKSITDMRHERDTLATANNHWSVQMGTHLSYADGDRAVAGSDATYAPYPIDCDLNTNANCADTDYAPCVSCHDPHGTAIVEPANPDTNLMMRRKWITYDTDPYLCRGCHP